ncbi:MAG: holo-ACP synthase [Mariprofundaceae bacterium]|nr:holo-ACP synthase [Mariprofundaceae bacterium]
MIVGIGVDRIALARVEKSLDRFGNRFVERIYTDLEYQLAQKKGVVRRLSMFFAAKEAVSKALGTGFIGFGMKEIEISYEPSGKPVVILHGGAKQCAAALNVDGIHLSLTDDDGVAMAFVVIEA